MASVWENISTHQIVTIGTTSSTEKKLLLRGTVETRNLKEDNLHTCHRQISLQDRQGQRRTPSG